jgi:N-acetylneuraminic acid mutarotase
MANVMEAIRKSRVRNEQMGARAAALALVALGCGGEGSMPAPPQLPAGGTWRAMAAMPAARQEVASAELGGKIFVIAGFDSRGDSTDSIFVYDPAANAWSQAAPLPFANNHAGAAVASGRLFAFGGVSSQAFVYDGARNDWTEVASMRFQHGSTPAVGVLDGRIYVAGGEGSTMAGNELESYDPAVDRWTVLPPMRVPRNHCAGQFIGGRFHVAGGRPGPAAESALEAFDPQTNAWTTLPSLPTGRSGVAAAAVRGRLYVFGGEGNRIFGEVEVFDPATNVWSRLAAMPTPRHGIFASVIGSDVYLAGGAIRPGFAATTVSEVFAVE